MAKPFDFGEVNLGVRTGRERASQAPDPETSFRVLILGDFSGRGSRGLIEAGENLASRRATLVDRDNFDEVMAKFGVRLSLPFNDFPLSIQFSELDDFHPDRLFERVQLFQKLRRIRKMLSDPATFHEAAAELGVARGSEASELPIEASKGEHAPASSASRPISGSLLEDAIIVTEGRSGNETPSRAPDEFSAFLHRAVAPHLASKVDPQQSELLSLIDLAASAQMRALLHLPSFQELEAAWRAIFFLVRRIETDGEIKLYLLDTSKPEIAADLASSHDLGATGLYKLLVGQTVRTPGAEPWALLAGNYTFGRAPDDLNLLTRLAKVAAAAGAPLIAGAHPGLLGCETVEDLREPRKWRAGEGTGEMKTWESLRNFPEASYLGLALPRFLLRLPYGKETHAAEEFDFEEMPETPARSDYLWGNPAFLGVCLMAEAFATERWAMKSTGPFQIDGLPLHIYKEKGEAITTPCAEILLTEDAVEQILESGVMPIISLKGRDAVRLIRLQSISNPLRGLSARWG